MDKVYKNIPEYIRTEVTQLRFVEPRFDRSKKARLVHMEPAYNSRQIRAILFSPLNFACALQTSFNGLAGDS